MPLSDISGPRDISFLLTACVEGSPSDSPPAADEADSDVLQNVSSDYTESSDSYSESDNSFEESVEDSGASVTLSDLMSRENEAEPPPNGMFCDCGSIYQGSYGALKALKSLEF